MMHLIRFVIVIHPSLFAPFVPPAFYHRLNAEDRCSLQLGGCLFYLQCCFSLCEFDLCIDLHSHQFAEEVSIIRGPKRNHHLVGKQAVTEQSKVREVCRILWDTFVLYRPIPEYYLQRSANRWKSSRFGHCNPHRRRVNAHDLAQIVTIFV